MVNNIKEYNNWLKQNKESINNYTDFNISHKNEKQKNNRVFLIILAGFIGFLMACGMMFYLAQNDKFRSEVLCEGSNLTSDCGVVLLQNNITLPQVNCDCGSVICPEFPSTLNLNCNNSS